MTEGHTLPTLHLLLDDNSGSIVLTTVDENSGNFWIWQIDGPTGSLDWERFAIQGTDSNDDTPRIRLPGPVVTQLDNDATPEMILTLPHDSNQADDGMGAQYLGMELAVPMKFGDSVLRMDMQTQSLFLLIRQAMG